MYLKVAICDNDQKDLSHIQTLLLQYEMNYDIDFEITIYTSGKALLNELKKSVNSFQLVFLDIKMPDINGIELANYIRKQLNNYDTQIIFITSHPEYMQDSFNVQAFHFICKPFSMKEIDNVMALVTDYFTHTQTTKLILHENDLEEIVYLDDILYIQVKNSQKRLLSVTLTSKTCQIKGRLADWQKELSEMDFVSPGREYLVNLKHVHLISEHELILDTGIKIPLSRRKHKEISLRFHQLLVRFPGNR